jgi:hypothetical protein
MINDKRNFPPPIFYGRWNFAGEAVVCSPGRKKGAKKRLTNIRGRINYVLDQETMRQIPRFRVLKGT